MKRGMLIILTAFTGLSVRAQWLVQTEPLDLGVLQTVTHEFEYDAEPLATNIVFSAPLMGAALMSLPVVNTDADMLKALAFQLADSYEWPVPTSEINKVYDYVASQIRTDPYMGLIRSPERVLLDKAGSPLEQCYLFAELLKKLNVATDFNLSLLEVPIESQTEYDICDLTGISDSAAALQVLNNGGMLYSATNGTATVYRVIVCAQTASPTTWVLYDPLWKKVLSKPQPIDPASWMGFSRSNLLAAAGGTVGTGWVKDVDEGSVTNLLNSYSETLRGEIEQMNLSLKNGTVKSFSNWVSAAYGFTPNSPSVTDISNFFTKDINGKLTIRAENLTPWTLNMWEVAHRKISIRFDSAGCAEIYLGDGSAGRRQSGTYSSSTPFTLTVDTVQAGITNTQNYSLERTGMYVLCQGFGAGTSGGMSDYVAKRITALKNKGFAGDSPEVFTESLRYTAQRWLAQEAESSRKLPLFSGRYSFAKYKIGIMAGQEAGFYIDVKNAWSFSGGSGADFTDMYLGSVLEHAVLEQLQPGNAKGISTIRILTKANRDGMKVYKADSNTWNSVKSAISWDNETQMQNDIQNKQGMYILPHSQEIEIDEWSGNGYVVRTSFDGKKSYGMMIGGDYGGGWNAWSRPYIPTIQHKYSVPSFTVPTFNFKTPQSWDPVDMQTGEFLFEQADFSLNGPLPLVLNRTYRSAAPAEVPVGKGWSHSLNIHALEHSAIDPAMGERCVPDMIPLLTGMTVIENVLATETGAQEWVVAAIVADWTSQQLIQNAVSVFMGSEVKTFVRQPDGTYTAPPGLNLTLVETNGVYVMQQRNANRYVFRPDLKLDHIEDPDGNTLAFSYNAQTNLQTVTSSFGPELSFNYTGDLITSVSDNSSPVRSVQYQYDTGNNLTNFTDAAGKRWGIAYSNTNHPHAVTSLIDPEGIVTIQNFYNDFGQVTNQISATGKPYNLFITDYISIERNPLNGDKTYEYDAQGRTVSERDESGAVTHKEYDHRNRIIREVGKNNTTNSFLYDLLDNLVEKREAVGTPEEKVAYYGYDSSSRPVAVSNQISSVEFQVSNFEYDSEHHLTKITDALGNETTFTYYPNGRLQQKNEANGQRITSYTYDAYGNVDTITSTDAGTVDLDYNARGELIQKTDARGQTTEFFYDPNGDQTGIQYADGSTASNVYWNNGLLKTATDARGYSVTNTWTPAYKPLTVRYPDGSIISNTYDAADRLIGTTKNTKNTNYELDPVGRITSVSSAYSVVENDYDALGNLTNSVVDPNGLNLWMATEYDSLNRPITRHSPLATEAWQYDSLSRMTNRIDQASKYWGSGYDALGRKTENLRPSGASEQFVYDVLGNRIGFYNAEGKAVTFGVDAQSRVTAITNAIGKVIGYQRDVNGNVTNRIDSLNRSTGYVFDGMNRIDRIEYPDGSTSSFDHDPNGNILSSTLTNSTGLTSSTTSFGYDEMNRLTGSTQSVYSVSSVVQNFYDFNGNCTNIVYPGGLNVSYSYDEEDRLIGVTTEYAENTESFSFGYDGASRLTNIVYPNGVGGEFSYDVESRIIGYSYSGSSNFISRTMARDARGYKTSETINSGLEPELIEGEQRFTNNSADQLTRIDQRDSWLGGELNQWYKREYGYDNNGCLIQEYVSRELWNTNSAIDEYRAEYTWDYDNHLTGAGKTVLVPHDTIDGMTGAVMDRTYTDGPSVSTEYIYDASGVRIGRVHNAVTNWFVIDYKAPLKMPLAETDADGNITRYCIWSSHGLLAHLDVNPSTGAITATRYYHADEQGSTLALTDETGAVTDQFAYTPYGGVTRTGTTDTPFQWLGGIAVQSEGDGLYFMLNRYYSAATKKFISTDPSGIDGGVNLYAYGNLNPLAFVDPYGLDAIVLNESDGARGFGHQALAVQGAAGWIYLSQDGTQAGGGHTAYYNNQEDLMRDLGGRYDRHFLIQTTPQQDATIYQSASANLNNPYSANPFNKNRFHCGDLVSTALRAGSVPTGSEPFGNRPNAAFKNIVSANTISQSSPGKISAFLPQSGLNRPTPVASFFSQTINKQSQGPLK